MMLRRLQRLACACLIVLGTGLTAWAQGVQTGVVTGTVTSPDGATVPGAMVSVLSPSLQGMKSAESDVNGVYVIRGLPPGSYTVTFELSGMGTVKKSATVGVGQTVNVDASLAPAGVSESVTVSAETPVVTNPTVGANYDAKMINTLPIGRTPFFIAELAPGLNSNGPNAGQISVSGAFAYDNVFMVDGVDINDNVFGDPNDLFIEDAIQETQVLTSGISAEYGRFSGGIISIVTKSGGDLFSGSFRTNLTNPAWTQETPYEKTNHIERTNNTSPSYEGTFGGPIVRSKLWFFGAGRYQNNVTSRTLDETASAYDYTENNKRYEVKLTATPLQNQTFSGSYLDNRERQENAVPLGIAIDPHTLLNRDEPNDIFVVSYNGVLSPKLFVTGQFSQKRFSFVGAGGTSTNLVDSPFISVGASSPGVLLYNAPYFDATDPEDRNNRQVTGSVSYFLSTPHVGSHDLKGGFEWFRSTNTGGNSQSSTGYVFDADYLTDAEGRPVIDGTGRMIPLFVPGITQLENWLPARGARIDIKTTSLYLHDRMTAGKRWTFDAGVRYEKVRSDASGGIVGVNTDTWMPRLAATYDVRGNGKLILQTTYGHYSGKYNDAQFEGNSRVANPNELVYDYSGPAGMGRDFAPGFNLANYGEPVNGTFPTANVFFAPGLHSPTTREFTASAGSQFNERLYGKLTYQWRSVSGFIEDFIDTTTGQTLVNQDGVDLGLFDNRVFRNSDVPQRDYQALLLQGQYRVSTRLTLQGHWTMMLKDEGDFEGEATNQPALSSLYGDYPEVFSPARNFPVGRFDDFQRHKIRLWATYNVPLGRFGSLDLSGMYRFNSGLAYSLTARNVDLTDTQLAIAEAAGYASAPNDGVQTLYFGKRGAQTFPGYALVDFSAQYGIPVWQTLRPYLKFDVYNLFNNDKLISWNTTVFPNFDGPTDALGLPTTYTEGPSFGKPTSAQNYPAWAPGGSDGGRTFRLAFGLRF
jgi:Carboxypeptidase regulatory-like domain/TonB dependent receptor/TonB-dependent Receptor Plug Domain